MVNEKLRKEAGYSETIREFVTALNRRVSGRLCMVRPGDEWVRVRPPDVQEILDFAGDESTVRFARVGAIVKILEADDPALRRSDDCYVDIECGGPRLLWSLSDFLGTFIRAVPQGAW